MARDIKNKILENVVKPYANKKFDTVKAIVVNYDNIRNRASIKFQDPLSSGEMILHDVPIQISSYEMNPSFLEKGSSVWVSFINGSPLIPRIIGLADEQYENKTRENLNHLKGGCLKVKLNNSNSTKASSVIDEDNDDITKYMEYFNYDIKEKIIDFKKNLGYFGEHDTGITNKYNSSVVKIMENGIIDIYVENNQGLRIDPNEFTIYIDSVDLNENNQNRNTNIQDWNIKSNNLNITSNNISLNYNKLIINGEEKNV